MNARLAGEFYLKASATGRQTDVIRLKADAV
jgi:hypothetical protein